MYLDKSKNIIEFEEADVSLARDFVEACDIFVQMKRLHKRHRLLIERLKAELNFIVEKEMNYLKANNLVISIEEADREIAVVEKEEDPFENLRDIFGR